MGFVWQAAGGSGALLVVGPLHNAVGEFRILPRQSGQLFSKPAVILGFGQSLQLRRALAVLFGPLSQRFELPPDTGVAHPRPPASPRPGNANAVRRNGSRRGLLPHRLKLVSHRNRGNSTAATAVPAA